MRIPRLRGGGALLKCPACRLKCLPAAVGPDGSCPRCGHERLLSMDIDRGWIRHTARTELGDKPTDGEH
ncbi:hypothetical protein [Streptomyces formicae]|uniref:Uncharacterized protein n=1 Tax=Streptomyces formicae TaxID=1616117 RepID=A0ABY3WW62_9ACTN|nr:hypothetical protein [Streptomyces formicae]UNM16908.1 hypothetical protein J4032_09740 [Streptomyces formicae]